MSKLESFLNFLRGMETSMSAKTVLVDGGFLNFLRGMETVDQGRLLVGAKKLPKLP